MKLSTRRTFASFMMAAMIAGASAQGTAEAEARRIATRFGHLAGSEDNAVALALALHRGAAVRLEPAGDGAALPEPVVLDITARPMAWNDVRVTLLHTQDALIRAGITRPTLPQVQAALLGGEVQAADGDRVLMRGVLRMREDGLSWVDIARTGAPQSVGAR